MSNVIPVNLKTLDKFPNLEYLNLSNTNTTDVKYLDALQKLKYLNISGNLLETFGGKYLPESLQVLDISRNPLKELPEDITVLPNLQSVNLDGNVFICSPENLELRDLLLDKQIEFNGRVNCFEYDGISWKTVEYFDDFLKLDTNMQSDQPIIEEGSADYEIVEVSTEDDEITNEGSGMTDVTEETTSELVTTSTTEENDFTEYFTTISTEEESTTDTSLNTTPLDIDVTTEENIGSTEENFSTENYEDVTILDEEQDPFTVELIKELESKIQLPPLIPNDLLKIQEGRKGKVYIYTEEPIDETSEPTIVYKFVENTEEPETTTFSSTFEPVAESTEEQNTEKDYLPDGPTTVTLSEDYEDYGDVEDNTVIPESLKKAVFLSLNISMDPSNFDNEELTKELIKEKLDIDKTLLEEELKGLTLNIFEETEEPNSTTEAIISKDEVERTASTIALILLINALMFLFIIIVLLTIWMIKKREEKRRDSNAQEEAEVQHIQLLSVTAIAVEKEGELKPLINGGGEGKKEKKEDLDGSYVELRKE